VEVHEVNTVRHQELIERNGIVELVLLEIVEDAIGYQLVLNDRPQSA